MEVHPIADLFPMLAEDELRELAADIKQRGLLQPIVLDKDGKILDGRNRHAACQIAGVEPQFTTYEGDDPSGYAVAVNVQRRNLDKGQAAMIAVRAAAVCGKPLRVVAQETGTSKARVAYASVVSQFAPELVDRVIAGGPGMTLDKAYEVARARKAEADAEAEKLAQLRDAGPDLAVLVENGVRDLEGALAEAEDRKTVREIDAIRDADNSPPPTFAQRAEEGAITWTEAATLAEEWLDERVAAIARAQAAVRNVLTHWGIIRTVAGAPDSKYVADIIDGLGEPDRKALAEVLASLNGVPR